MPNLDKHGNYVSRRHRETQAFRAVKVGSAAAVGTVGTGVLAIAGILSTMIPILLLILTALCVWQFSRTTGRR